MTSTPRNVPDNNSDPSFLRSLTTRTSLITTVAIAGVLLAGGAAIAANIGILSAADNSELGELAATELVATPVFADTTTSSSSTSSTSTSTTTPSVGATSDYVVDAAGTVSLLTSDSGLSLGAATANDGWTPALSQSEPTSLTVVFTNSTRTVVFTALLGADGTIVADVTEPTVVTGAAPSGPITAPTTPSYDNSSDHDDDSYEDHSDEDHSDEDESEDDEHEYEGADDDD